MAQPDDKTKIKDEVKRFYGDMVAPSEGAGCCGGLPPTGIKADPAHYSDRRLADLPKGLTLTSFGCGNPVDFMEVKPGETVLDLGCGTGLDLFLAAKKVGSNGRVIGIDMTPAMIARAQANIAAAGATNIEVRQGEMEHLPVDDGSVDWVMSNCVINLSPDKGRVFAEIFRVLRPGGRMLVSDIVTIGDLSEAVRSDMRLWAGCIAGALDEGEFVDQARNAGLSEVRIVDRFLYDRPQLTAFISDCCSCGTKSEATAPPLESLAGKIASAKIFARKPEK